MLWVGGPKASLMKKAGWTGSSYTINIYIHTYIQKETVPRLLKGCPVAGDKLV